MPRLEVDVRFLADDAMVIFHDSHLDRSTTGTGRVDEATRSELQRTRYRDDPQFGPCFLEDVIDSLHGSSTLLQVDLKLMRPISDRRVHQLEEALAPIAGRVIVGSQAHWNLRALNRVPVAFDPTLQWSYSPDGPPPFPRTLGLHGLWDDSPLALNPRFGPVEYVEQRITDIRGMLPQAVEWMVDIATIFRLSELGVDLGERLRSDGCSLAAWTLHKGDADTADTVSRLFAVGVETIITDAPEDAAACLASGIV